MFNIFKSKRRLLSWRKIKEGDKITYEQNYEKRKFTRIVYGIVESKFYIGEYKPNFINRILNRSKKYQRQITVKWFDYKGKLVYAETISESSGYFYFYKYNPDYTIIQRKIVRLENCVIGDKVVRGDDWDYDWSGDEGSLYGIVIGFDKTRRCSRNDICIVRWIYEDYENDNKYHYNIGPHKFELYFYEEEQYEEDEQTYSY